MYLFTGKEVPSFKSYGLNRYTDRQTQLKLLPTSIKRNDICSVKKSCNLSIFYFHLGQWISPQFLHTICLCSLYHGGYQLETSAFCAYTAIFKQVRLSRALMSNFSYTGTRTKASHTHGTLLVHACYNWYKGGIYKLTIGRIFDVFNSFPLGYESIMGFQFSIFMLGTVIPRK